MVDFSKLKKQSSTGSNLEKLTKAIESLNDNSNGKDANFWKPEVDKAGNGYAVIRFLPASAEDGEDALPWVKLWTHGFKGPGGWYIENSLTTLNQADPVSEYNTTLWNSGLDSNKALAREQKRKLSYISNILVVEDPKHPECNGKVYKYKYGTKIYDKLISAMKPEFPDDPKIDPFDMWKGANFKLKIRKYEGYQNYDKCEFDDISPVAETDKEIEAIWKQTHCLKDEIDPKNFKTYDQLKARMQKVLGLDGGAPAPQTTVEKAKAVAKTQPKRVVEESEDSSSFDSDDDMEYFSKLAED